MPLSRDNVNFYLYLPNRNILKNNTSKFIHPSFNVDTHT